MHRVFTASKWLLELEKRDVKVYSPFQQTFLYGGRKFLSLLLHILYHILLHRLQQVGFLLNFGSILLTIRNGF